MDERLKRQQNESDDQYFYRICKMRESLGFTWYQMADIFNEEFGCDKGDTAYRKRWNAFERVLNANVDQIIGGDIQEQIDELYKAKRQLYDQRREYNKLLVSDARADHLTEKLIEAARLAPLKDYSGCFKSNTEHSDEEALICLSDWHYGMISNNIWNEYSVDICEQRVKKLFNKVVGVIQQHGVKTLSVALLGDLINGCIHTSSRVASEENACEQLMHVSELLANFINELSKYVDEINVYSTYGNHARMVQNKADSIHADNVERVIPWWLKERLKGNKRIHVIDSGYYEFIYLQICGYGIVCSHGDLEKFKSFGVTANTLFTKKYGKSIDYTFSADKHHLEVFEQMGIESALVGSLCGVDEYANNRRLYSKPMQTICVFTPEDGKLCTYNIQL